MIGVIIVGISAYSRLLRRLIEVHYNPYATSQGGEALSVVGYFDMFRENEPDRMLDDLLIYDKSSLLDIIHTGSVGAILLPEQPMLDIQYLMHWFRSVEIYQDAIYFTATDLLTKKEFSDEDIEKLIVPYNEASYLPYLEFHIEDSCNMNCRACEHYSPLVKRSDDSKMVYEDVERDFIRLKELIDRVGRIRVLGGEPLLNPELPRYLRMVRRIYPEADLFVVTNALLLDRLSDETYETMKETNAVFMISYYPPLEGRLEDAISKCTARGVEIINTPLIREFSMRQNLHGNNDARHEFDMCFQSTCNNLYKGQIAACMLPFMTHYFNETFDKDLPLDGAIDLYDDSLTTQTLKERLAEPFSRCSYCGEPVFVPWKQASREPDIHDFVLDDTEAS